MPCVTLISNSNRFRGRGCFGTGTRLGREEEAHLGINDECLHRHTTGPDGIPRVRHRHPLPAPQATSYHQLHDQSHWQSRLRRSHLHSADTCLQCGASVAILGCQRLRYDLPAAPV